MFGLLKTDLNAVNTKTPVASILASSPSSTSLAALLRRYIDNVDVYQSSR